jgi:hypothetical protein
MFNSGSVRICLFISATVAFAIGWISISNVTHFSRIFIRNDVASAVSNIIFPQLRLPSQSLCVLGIFRNESLNIREWISHYKWQGVSAIILLDNGSTDAWRSELSGFEGFVTVLDAPQGHEQVEQYNTLGLPWLFARECEYAAIIDIDEFFYVAPTDAYNKSLSLRDIIVSDFVSDRRVSQISCNWLMFGSSGLVKHPHGGVRLNFTFRASDLHPNKKSFVRVASVKRFVVHEHEVIGTSKTCPENVRLNHYAIQSREYFERVKMARGDVASANLDTHRDWNYFAAYDFAEVRDEVLRDLVLKEES